MIDFMSPENLAILPFLDEENRLEEEKKKEKNKDKIEADKEKSKMSRRECRY